MQPSIFVGYRGATSIFVTLALVGCAHSVINANDDPEPTAFVVLGENGTPVARVLTSAARCPVLLLDGRQTPMNLRAPAETMPLRQTRSSPADSKPASFPLMTCELIIPPHTTSATVNGRSLPLPAAEIKKIVVIGDTGCRLKKSENAFQPCNDPDQYPFAKVAAAAAKWKPDLVIHVGDFHYRENACPADNAGCAGSTWGYGWDAWRDDFFKPGAALLNVAPWVMARGNHESCARAGQGWFRFLDPRPLEAGRDCNDAENDDRGDFSDPYAVPIGDRAQLIVLDTSNTTGGPIPQGDIREIKYRDLYRKLDELSQQATYNIGVNHHPILGFTAKQHANGNVSLLPGNQGIQSVFGTINPLMLPPRMTVMLSGHAHLWEEVSFSSPHPTQFIAGFSGTMEDVVPLPSTVPIDASPARGAVVQNVSAWTNGFGFMTMERNSTGQWTVKVWDLSGRPVKNCRIDGSKSTCELLRAE